MSCLPLIACCLKQQEQACCCSGHTVPILRVNCKSFDSYEIAMLTQIFCPSSASRGHMLRFHETPLKQNSAFGACCAAGADLSGSQQRAAQARLCRQGPQAQPDSCLGRPGQIGADDFCCCMHADCSLLSPRCSAAVQLLDRHGCALTLSDAHENCCHLLYIAICMTHVPACVHEHVQ